jgi:peptide/nickel transport system permease protein
MAEASLVPRAERVGRSPRRQAWRRFARNKAALVGLVFLLAIHVTVVVGPAFVPHAPERTSPRRALQPPSATHLLGTDELGRDHLARLLHGGRVTLAVGMFAMTVALVVGTVVGAAAAFFGRWTETLLMRFTDAMMAIPSFFLVLVAITVMGNQPATVVLVIGLTSWMAVARVVYGEVLSYRTRDFVSAAEALGARRLRIIVRHVLPMTVPSLIVSATLGVAFAILIETAISYLGLGIQPPIASWGNMLQNAQQYIWESPALAVWPGILTMLTVLAFNVVGDGLRDALDPKVTR